jgi:hypothetical protein
MAASVRATDGLRISIQEQSQDGTEGKHAEQIRENLGGTLLQRSIRDGKVRTSDHADIATT